MKKLIMIVLLFSLSGLFPKEKSGVTLTEKEQLRLEIEESQAYSAAAFSEAQKFYYHADQQSKALTVQILDELNALDVIIQEGKLNGNVNKDLLFDAQKDRNTAASLIDGYNYESASLVIAAAMGKITTLPIVRLKAAPLVFSPDADGYDDFLLLSPSVQNKNPVVSWKITLSQVLRENDEEILIPVKEVTGQGAQPESWSWDGVLEDGIQKVNSVSPYSARLEVTDDRGGKGTSPEVRFKTDIFIIKTARGLKIDVSSIQFDFDKDQLKDEYKEIVARIYGYLGAYPAYTVAVEGHSDPVGKADYNYDLSQRRAQSVASYLLELGMDKEKLYGYGLGESTPVTLKKEKLALNRRVSFILLKSGKDVNAYQKYISKVDLTREAQPE